MARRGGGKVLVIYTGGTIGSKPTYPDDPDSPQRVVPWDEFRASLPELDRLPFEIDAVSMDEPLDSCNIGPTEWSWIARSIADGYDDHDGFVVLHGTDTMVYTASVLSFMLRGLNKPVVLTGAQRSALVGVRNDAYSNLFTALEVANPRATGIVTIPEVCICFGGRIFRGNRTRKLDTAGYQAFDSPNAAPLAEVGTRIVVAENIVRPLPTGMFHVRTALDANVLRIAMMPVVQTNQAVARQLGTPGLRAAVVECFGSGSLPTHPDLLETFRRARQRGTVLAVVSQCARGRVELGPTRPAPPWWRRGSSRPTTSAPKPPSAS